MLTKIGPKPATRACNRFIQFLSAVLVVGIHGNTDSLLPEDAYDGNYNCISARIIILNLNLTCAVTPIITCLRF